MVNVLIEEYRGGLLENTHYGVICGVNELKQPIYRVGDIERQTFFRSASKPIQAIPNFIAEIDLKYKLTSSEKALFTASHRGETYHIDNLRTLQAKLDIDEQLLYCPKAYPLNEQPKLEMIKMNMEKTRLFHNCSGKHLGFIATCKEMGYPIEGYWQLEHPLQQQILHILSYLAEVSKDEIHIGIDGCGVPVFSIPLRNMAISTLKLACPELIEDSVISRAVKRMTVSMNEAPLIVASHNFICSTLLEDPNIVAKGGAKGVYCFALKEEKLAFALKVFDGSEEVWPNVIAGILEQIQYKNIETIEKVKKLRSAIILTDDGIEVGEIKVAFNMKK